MQLHFFYIFAFILDLHATKTLTMLYFAAFGCKHYSARYRELSFFRFPLEKQTVVKQRIHNCERAGWKPTRYARLCSTQFEESCFEVFHGSNEWVKIFQNVGDGER